MSIKPYLVFFALLLLSAPVAGARKSGPPPSPVVVSAVVEKEIRRPIALLGAVEPMRKSLVASEVVGLVEKMDVREGDYVKKGRVLARLRRTPLKIELREAAASKREAEARYALAEQNYYRFKKLYDKGVASVQDFQDARSERDAWAARIQQSAARVEKLNYDIEKSEIRAPFEGYVTKKRTEVGEWIRVSDPVVELIELASVEVAMDVPARYAGDVRVGDTSSLRFDAYPGRSFKAKISSVIPQADSAARNFTIKYVLVNKDRLLMSGMVARANLMVGEKALVKMVPKDSIVDMGGSKIVFLVIDGVAKPAPVKEGIALGELIEVRGPIETGQSVVIRGNERLRPGQHVRVIPGAEMPEKS